MEMNVHSTKLLDLVDKDAALEKLAGGFKFTEGPIWNSTGNYLLFSDIPDDAIYRWDENGIASFRKPSGKSNGLTYDGQLNLIACEHATSRVSRTMKDGTISVVASHWQGKEMNSPNDVIVKSDGSIYFTDPVYGRSDFVGIKREQELSFQGVYRVTGSGKLELLADDFEAPNGICFSPDEQTLYVNDTKRMHIRAFEVREDGDIENGRILLEMDSSEGPGVPDGMKVDERGNLYCTGAGGIWVISPGGEHIGTIRVPEMAANLNWGGENWDILYITASTSIYRIKMKVRGNRVGYMS